LPLTVIPDLQSPLISLHFLSIMKWRTLSATYSWCHDVLSKHR
jgi:hypothetical protein